MKKTAAILLAVLLLTGCSVKNKELERGIRLRTKLLSAAGCSFDADITADYGDKLHTFSMQCRTDGSNVHFTVTKPESISGIEGIIDGTDGKLTFDETVLFFPLLADEQVTPVSAPWILVNTLRSGYITSAGADGALNRLSINDSYQDDALNLDIWLNAEDVPVRSEILYRGHKILSLDVKNFRME